MTPSPPVEESCFWMARRHARRTPEPLQGVEEADVAIVGGGYTGLWTSLFLKELEPRRKVVVLEQELVGYGGSGRNAGIVGETIDHSHELAIAHFGLDEARRLARLGRENLDAMETFLRERGIDAGFERRGQLIVALRPEHLAALDQGREAAESVGSPGWRILSRDETRSELASPLYEGALLAPRNGVVDPVRLTEGLRFVAVQAGVRIHERTRVTRLAFRGDRVEISAGAAMLRARKLVLATNAYSHHLRPSLARRFLERHFGSGTQSVSFATDDIFASADAMIANGVPAARLLVVSWGKERPVAQGSNEEAWAQNRRAVTVVVR